jgi:hypothetical protein
MTGVVSISTLIPAVIMGPAGTAFGLAYFTALRRTVGLYRGNNDGALAPVAFTLGRIAGAVIFLALAARLGAEPLIGAFLGFLVARAIALRLARRGG